MHTESAYWVCGTTWANDSTPLGELVDIRQNFTFFFSRNSPLNGNVSNVIEIEKAGVKI